MQIRILAKKCSYIDYDSVGKVVWETLSQKEDLYCELIFCSEDEIKTLNRDIRGKDSVTDVLSFPSIDSLKGVVVNKNDYPSEFDESEQAVFIGSVAICTKRAKEQAKEYGHGCKREFTFLLVHALLHLMGYDHIEEQDRIEMRAKEDLIMEKLGAERV